MRNRLASLLLLGTSLFAFPLNAAPEGGQISAGDGQISQSGTNTTINQQSQNLAINWQGFNIGANEAVRFNQPGASSIALNRVLGQDPSHILGQLSANGQIFIMNPNGVLFGSSARVNVGGLVATTLGLSDADFMSGKHQFTNSGGAGSVVNQGELNAAEGGYIALLAPQVKNEGIVRATLGTAVLAAGDQVTLNLDNGSLISYSVDKGSLDALVENKQLVEANGGRVYMTAKAADAVSKAAVNNTGIVEAQTVAEHGGVIELIGDETVGTVTNSGTLDVSSATGAAGKAIVTAHHVLLDQGSTIKASGRTQGGKVYIGGGRQGQDASIKNASAVIMAPTAKIDVSSSEGAGGEAVLWSDDYTNFLGSINAAGTTKGEVETSSLDNLQALGSVIGANWLLDPAFQINIAASGASGDAYTPDYNPSSSFATILASSIEDSLNQGTNVTITAATYGTINFNAPIAMHGASTGTNSTLTANSYSINVTSGNSISSDQGKLNVVFNASGGYTINAAINTNGGNFSGTASNGTVNITSGSVTVGTGSIAIVSSNGGVNLGTNALNIGYTGSAYDNSNNWTGHANSLTISSVVGVTSNNSDTSIPNIVTATDVSLTNTGPYLGIGSSSNPLTISGQPDLLGDATTSTTNWGNVQRTLTITNNQNTSNYIYEMGTQVFGTYSLNIGNTTSQRTYINIMSNAGDHGHIDINSNGSGVFTFADNAINVSGTGGTDPSVFAPNLNINFGSSTVSLSDGAIKMGTGYSYWNAYGTNNHSYHVSTSPSLTLSAGTFTAVDGASGTAEIQTPNVFNITATNIGTTSADAIEVDGGGSLTVTNSGGSTYMKILNNNFSNITFNANQSSGTHAIHFSGGDHLDFSGDGTNINIPTIAATGCTTTTSCGILLSGSNRNLTLSTTGGDQIFANSSLNIGEGNLTVNQNSTKDMILGDNAIIAGNTTLNGGSGWIKAANAYNSSATAAQITTGNLTMTDSSSYGIGGGTKDLQIAQKSGHTDNTLTVTVSGGNVFLHELTANHFKTLSTTMNGTYSAGQRIYYDLNGADEVNFTDSGSLVSIDATKVNLSANNRNWNLSTPSRSIQVDSTSIGSGYYTLSAGQYLNLNADVNTNDGAITLTGGSGIVLKQATVRVDSNSDNTGASGAINIQSNVSGNAAGRAFVVDSSSTSTSAGTITLNGGANNAGGNYLGSYTSIATGANANGTQDGTIYYNNGSYLLNGSLDSTGNTILNTSLTIDTEQGNTADAGSISFHGYNLSGNYYQTYAFNTATTGAGKNGGVIDLYGTTLHNTFYNAGVTATSTGGAGGTAGSISLPSMNSTNTSYTNTQTYTGGIINLYGDLMTDRGNVTLTGDTRLQNSITIDTWAGVGSRQTASAGNILINGTGISDGGSNHILGLDTSTSTGSGYYTGTTDYTHSSGTINIIAGNAGGNYVQAITGNSTVNGTHNAGTIGTTTLNNVGTILNQTYSGGVLALNNGAVTTSGGNISFANMNTVTVTGDVTLDTDRSGGNGNAGTLDFNGKNVNGAGNLTIDLTADGTGTGSDLTLQNIGTVTPLTTLYVMAKNITVGTGGITAANDVTLSSRGSSAVLTVNEQVKSNSGGVTLQGIGTSASVVIGTGGVQGAGDVSVSANGANGSISTGGLVKSTGGKVSMTSTGTSAGLTIGTGGVEAANDVTLTADGASATLATNDLVKSTAGKVTLRTIGTASSLTVGTGGILAPGNILLSAESTGASIRVNNLVRSTAGNILAEALSTTSDITLNAPLQVAGGTITAAAGRNFLNNNASGTGLVTTTGRYMVYSTDPAATLEGMTGYSKHYDQAYTSGSVPAYAAAGSWFFYSLAPSITVTPDLVTLAYNDTFSNSKVTPTYSGFIDGDTFATAGISGTPEYSAATSPAGKHDIAYFRGLASSLGYRFIDNAGSSNELTVLAPPNNTPGGQIVAGQPNGDSLIPAYTGVITSVASSNAPGGNGGGTDTSNATNPTSETGGSAGSVPTIIHETTLVQTGNVTVENGGMNMPTDFTGTGTGSTGGASNNTSPSDSDDDDDNKKK